ncbi:hypothetical protein Tco_1042657 [Tanacetum coccineum]|uniref:Uncharacterized protein n=1 Tax=Tanacetum coccineum TaxID=301880 RepID=A0ABQ5GJR0_9ASTR
MVVKSEILYDFPRFFGVLIAKLAASGAVNITLKMKRATIIEILDLKPKIDAMMREFLKKGSKSDRATVYGRSLSYTDVKADLKAPHCYRGTLACRMFWSNFRLVELVES